MNKFYARGAATRPLFFITASTGKPAFLGHKKVGLTGESHDKRPCRKVGRADKPQCNIKNQISGFIQVPSFKHSRCTWEARSASAGMAATTPITSPAATSPPTTQPGVTPHYRQVQPFASTISTTPPQSASSSTTETRPPFTAGTSSPAAAAASTPLCVRQSPRVALYTSSSPL